MSEREPSNAELLGAIAAAAMTLRGMMDEADRTSRHDLCEMLDFIEEGLAVVGGSALHLSDRLGCTPEVKAHVQEGLRRVQMAKAFAGHGGRA